MTHVKSNSLTTAEITSRLLGKWNHLKSDRTELFLEIYWKIHAEWNNRLNAVNAIDFEDMLIQAAGMVENNMYVPDYDLILVDEFQDSSSARARLVKSLLKLKGKFVLVVGDDRLCASEDLVNGWRQVEKFVWGDNWVGYLYGGVATEEDLAKVLGGTVESLKTHCTK